LVTSLVVDGVLPMHTCAFSIIKLIPHMVDSPLFCDCVCAAGMYVIQKYNNQIHPRGEEVGKGHRKKGEKKFYIHI
jgi:hypothetical protein